jgi:hypothetical protein
VQQIQQLPIQVHVRLRRLVHTLGRDQVNLCGRLVEPMSPRLDPLQQLRVVRRQRMLKLVKREHSEAVRCDERHPRRVEELNEDLPAVVLPPGPRLPSPPTMVEDKPEHACEQHTTQHGSRADQRIAGTWHDCGSYAGNALARPPLRSW